VDQLLALQQLLTALADRLEAELAGGSGNPGITVVRGWEAATSDGPEAQALHAAGAGWTWVALGFAEINFWDLHVGILDAGDPAASAARVGLHWKPALDDVVRPLAERLAPAEHISFSPAAGEYQQDLPGPLPADDPVPAALDLARRTAAALATRPRITP
jgi:hypothetical protein